MPIELTEVLDTLGYSRSTHFYSVNSGGRPQRCGPVSSSTNAPPEHLRFLRMAGKAGVNGVYTFPTRPESGEVEGAPRPAVLVAGCQSESSEGVRDEAVSLQNKVWNLGFAPFLIVVLPHQIRLYSGFSIQRQGWDTRDVPADTRNGVENSQNALLDEFDSLQKIVESLKEFRAQNIDNGQVWRSKYARQLDASQRVDQFLLRSLRGLSATLEEHKLPRRECNSLIGKYIYLRYLRDRGVLEDSWMTEQGIDPESVFGLRATRKGLFELVRALETRFNGKVFPLVTHGGIADEHVQLAASVMRGDTYAPGGEMQPHLPFAAFDFRHIPVETLSSIYEDFLHSPDPAKSPSPAARGSSDKSKANVLPAANEIGAVYTPELVADYVLAEVESKIPLQPGIKVLDPACGSGVFLVLAFQRMVEYELDHTGVDLKPERLKEILSDNIFGVEREEDACFVTEFSLILTMLHYCDPPTLRALSDFKFPSLHNLNIFHDDFFNVNTVSSSGQKTKIGELKTPAPSLNFWGQSLRVNVVVGNPPWVSLEDGIASKSKDKPGRSWISETNAVGIRPVGDYRVAEAFSWLVNDCLVENGPRIIGLLLPATSLFNAKSQGFRQAFFKKNEVLRVTNFAHLREVLFEKRTDHPAAAIIYRPMRPGATPPKSIVHYAPLLIDQRNQNGGNLWSLTINEGDIQEVDYQDACRGLARTWKLALWGSPRDRDVLERLEQKFPINLNDFGQRKSWILEEGPTLQKFDPQKPTETQAVEELHGQRVLDAKVLSGSNFRFSIPTSALKEIPAEKCFIRKRGGGVDLKTMHPPHLVIAEGGLRYTAYSEDKFVMSPSQFCIATPVKDKALLRAMALYLSSTVASYQTFFLAQQWGVWRQARLVLIQELRQLPVPKFTKAQVASLAHEHTEITRKEEIGLTLESFHQEVLLDESETPASSIPSRKSPAVKKAEKKIADELHTKLQKRIDQVICDTLNLPEDIRTILEEWREVRLPMDREAKSANAVALSKPTEMHLRLYARELRDQLEDFTGMPLVKFKVKVTYSANTDLIQCSIEKTQSKTRHPEVIDINPQVTMEVLLENLQEELQEKISQWVYVQRGLRLYDGPRIFLFKEPRRINWTRTQAINDASEIIGSVLSRPAAL